MPNRDLGAMKLQHQTAVKIELENPVVTNYAVSVNAPTLGPRSVALIGDGMPGVLALQPSCTLCWQFSATTHVKGIGCGAHIATEI